MFLFGPCSVFMHKLLCFLAIVSSFWRKSITNHVPLTLTIPVTGERRVQPPNKHIKSCLLPYKTKVHYYYCYCVSQAGAKSDPWPLICTFWWADSVHDGRGRGLAANILTNCKISNPDPRPPPCDQKSRRGYSIRHFWLCCFYHHHKENVVIVAISNWTILYFLNRNSWCLRMSEYKGDGDNVRFLERVQIFRHDMG